MLLVIILNASTNMYKWDEHSAEVLMKYEELKINLLLHILNGLQCNF